MLKFRDLKVGEEFFFADKTPRSTEFGPFRKTHLSNGPNRWDECWYLDKDYWCYYGNSADRPINRAIPKGEE